MRLFFITVILLSGFHLLAQSQERGQRPSNGILSGTVVDDKGKPVEYATVSLFSKKDSSLLTGGITNSKGYFKLSELKWGVYILNIKFLGFQNKQIKPVFLMPKGRGKGEGIQQDLGLIKLENSDVAIDDVNVIADKAHVQYKIDRKIVNVSQDINASSGTAVDVLENTPSVNVDIDGNVELRGSSNFTVLIDGKPTVLEASEALQQVPASLIENIEIITNPSAKFDPDGAAGIINLVMKKKKFKGINGVVNLSAGTGDKYKGNLLLNYRANKFNVFAGVNYRDEKRYGKGMIYRRSGDVENPTDTIYYTDYNGSRDRIHAGLGYQAGFDFYINDFNTLSISGKYDDREFSRNSESFYHDWTEFPDIINNTEEYYLRTSKLGYEGYSYSLNANYALRFKNPQQKLDVMFHYAFEEGTRIDDNYKYLTDNLHNISDPEPEKLKGNEPETEEDIRYQIDYVSPIGENGVFEAGFQGRLETESDAVVYKNFDYTPAVNDWVIDNEKGNETEYTRNIQAGYFTFANKLWGFDYKIGFRSEYTDRTFSQLKNDEKYTLNRFDFFPSAYLTREISKNQQIQASFSRRMNRPRGRMLDPDSSYSDAKRIRVGNPELEPEYVDSYELNFQQRFNKSFIAIETYHRKTSNRFDRRDILQSGDTIVSTWANLDYTNATGVELSANLSIGKIWRVNASTTAYLYEINGEVNDESVSKESYNWDFRLSNTFSFKTKTKVELRAFYRGPSITAEGSRKAFFFSNLAVKQDFMDSKLSVTAQVRDLLGGMKFKITKEQNDLYSDLEFTREGTVFTLALTYRLNNYKQKRNSRNGNGGDMDMDVDM